MYVCMYVGQVTAYLWHRRRRTCPTSPSSRRSATLTERRPMKMETTTPTLQTVKTNKRFHTYIHAYIHTYIHTYLNAYVLCVMCSGPGRTASLSIGWGDRGHQPARGRREVTHIHTYIHAHSTKKYTHTNTLPYSTYKNTFINLYTY